VIGWLSGQPLEPPILDGVELSLFEELVDFRRVVHAGPGLYTRPRMRVEANGLCPFDL